jgi:hypothetical protein
MYKASQLVFSSRTSNTASITIAGVFGSFKYFFIFKTIMSVSFERSLSIKALTCGEFSADLDG